MATKFVSALTGPEMDQALTDMAYHNSEAYAVGTRNGVAVGSSDVTYHNNSKYWAEQVYGYTDRAEDAANRAEAAVPSGTAGAVFFDRAQTLTTAQQGQAKANISAGSTNPNLLDNPFFTVNQRSFTSSTGVNNIYSVDRWYIARGTGTISKTNNGITIDGTSASRETTFQQMIDCGDFTGRAVTVSINDGGTIRQITGTVPARTTSNNIFIRFTLRDGVSAFIYAMSTSSAYAYMLQVQVNAGYTIDIRAVKLELGSVSTLANDAPPDYGEELAKCQRYFLRLYDSNYTYLPVGYGIFSNGTVARMFFPTPVSMRKVTSVSFGGATLQIAGAGAIYTVTALSVQETAANGVMVQATASSSLTLYQPYFIVMNDGGYIDLSADL